MRNIRLLALLCTGMFALSGCGKSDSAATQPAGSVEDEISVQEQDESEDDLQQNSDNSVEDKYLALVYDSYAYGYIDENGEEVIECQYDYAKNFSHNGLAPVRDENDLWGYIDTEGNLVIDCIYEEAGTFTENGLALVESRESINDEGQRTYSYGFIDETGDTVVPFEYTDASDYKNGYARVEKDGLWGFVDESGEEIIPCQYSQAGDFAPNGLAPVRSADGLYGYINKNNEVIIDFQFMFAGSFGNNTDLAPVKNQEELCGYINSSGELIIDYIFASVCSFDDLGYARVILPEDMAGYGPVYMGYINSDGVAITNNNLRNGYEFSENGLALVAKGEFGYINTYGRYVIPFEYDYATDFGDNGWAAVGWDGGSWEHENSRLFYINQNGEEVLACDQYEAAYEFIKVSTDNKSEMNTENSEKENDAEQKTENGENIDTQIDLKKVVGNNIFDFVNESGDFKDVGSTSGSLDFSNEQVIVTADCDSKLISFVSIDAGDHYNFDGIRIGMTDDEGYLILDSKDWVLFDMDNESCWRFRSRGQDDTLTLYIDEDRTITGISYQSALETVFGTGNIDGEQAFSKIKMYYKTGKRGITVDDFTHVGIEGQLYESTVKENGVPVYKLTVNCSNGCVSEQNVNTGKIYNYSVLEL